MIIKHLHEIITGSFFAGAINTGWYKFFCDFRPVSRYIMQTIQDSAIWKANRKPHPRFRIVSVSMTLSDL